MSDTVFYDPMNAGQLVTRWTAQASQMRTTTGQLTDASKAGLPDAAIGAAQTFLTMWEKTAREASVAADVYADELKSTGTSYKNLDDEIARRMAALNGGAQ